MSEHTSVAYRSLVENLTLDRTGKRHRSVRRMWSMDRLPMPRAFFRGPRWKRLCGVSETPIAEIDPVAAQYHRPGRKLMIFSFEDEVRERVLEPLGHDVFACWSDPYERFNITRSTYARRGGPSDERCEV